ncbi:ABC transporter ATP-binding protein [Methylocaldum sp.]|uniref:ABC transporter ATP-binding protein n=1 Tax=Methylocaldum sp. TaxID=1969727 RepID=UPI002D249CF8|nr:ABC transporter ATP-binding protein [Methylocaldum sp.]HYE34997.1 ABC transporter ATP-binding protein [Methylocaldum sp.]
MRVPAIEVHGLCKRYGPVVAVDGISFDVPEGATCALLGGNGAGKTTTLGMLLGLLLPSSGSIRILGVDMVKNRYAALSRMNFTSPYVDLPHRLTVKQNLDVYARLYGIRHRARRLRSLAETFDLEALMHRSYGSLSAGQRTRVALAKALLNEPEVLLMDEPTASLDPASADTVRTFLKAYQQRSGSTVLLASHNMQEVERLCDSVLILKQGRIVDQGTPAMLVQKYGRDSLEQVFIDIARDREHQSA